MKKMQKRTFFFKFRSTFLFLFWNYVICNRVPGPFTNIQTNDGNFYSPESAAAVIGFPLMSHFHPINYLSPALQGQRQIDTQKTLNRMSKNKVDRCDEKLCH